MTLVGIFLLTWDPPGILLLIAVGSLSLTLGLGGVAATVAGDAPRLAAVAGVFTAAAGVVFAWEFTRHSLAFFAGVSMTPFQVGGYPHPNSVGYWLLGAGLLLAGIGALWQGTTPRSVGALLVVASLTLPAVDLFEFLAFELWDGAMLVGFTTFGAALALAGVLLDAERITADPWLPPTPEPTDGGWTNEHVREGYDVDGSQLPTDENRMPGVQQLFRLFYELLGGRLLFPRSQRRLDRFRRWFGRLRDREAEVEEGIARREYIRETVTATPREGVGSSYWRLGMHAFVGVGFAASLGFLWIILTLGSLVGLVAGLVVMLGGILIVASSLLTFRNLCAIARDAAADSDADDPAQSSS